MIASPQLRMVVLAVALTFFAIAFVLLAMRGTKLARAFYQRWQLKRHSLSIDLARCSSMIVGLLAETDRKNDAMKGQPISQSVVRKINDRGAVAEYREKILPAVLELLKRARWLGVGALKKQCMNAETFNDLQAVADGLKALVERAGARK
ncbi:hypothetical protein JW848_11250 [Candidatus Bipolaricaulota bacterium]|nr:hypothetical protein [Candidatus Bipolaricaulota bacterium]